MSQAGSHSEKNPFITFLKRRWLAIVLVVLLVIVAIQNAVGSDTATIFLLWGQLAMPTWALVLIIFVIGAIAGWMMSRNRAARQRR
ncbi:LapA family protein [Leifsonia aquatica]|uniref:LapA family protein n=1 Tax=Leifsonia aquatica TaxID=144185 RepID=UPI0004687E9C|nr:LapA family protein [Leifsonia aquatica]